MIFGTGPHAMLHTIYVTKLLTVHDYTVLITDGNRTSVIPLLLSKVCCTKYLWLTVTGLSYIL